MVDDGSSDDTRRIVDGFPDVHYLFQTNSGLSSARNTALNLTTSTHILFLDADDFLEPDALQAATYAFRSSDTPLAFVYGGFREVAENGKILSTHRVEKHVNPRLALLKGNFIAMNGTVLFNVAALRRSGGFDPNLKSCEDYDIYLRLARTLPIQPYDYIAANYRRHTNSLSANRFFMIKAALEVIDRHSSPELNNPDAVDAAREGRN